MAFTGILGAAQLGGFLLGSGSSAPNFDPHVSHTLTLTQLAVSSLHNPIATNTLVISQVAHYNVYYAREVDQSLTLMQFAVKSVEGIGSNTLTLSQTATFLKVRNVVAANSLALSQDAERSMSYSRVVNQGMILTHAAPRNMSYARSIVQPITLTQTDPVTASKATFNTLTLSQDAEFVYSHGARTILEMTQLVAVSVTYIQSLHDFLGVFHRVATIGTYTKTPSSFLALTQVASGQVTKSVLQHLSLTHQADGQLVTPAFDTVFLSQLANVSKTSNVEGDNLLILNQDVEVERSIAVAASNALGMSQFARGTKRLTVSASNSLILTQALVQRYFDESVPQTLTLSDSATVQKIAKDSASQVLTLTQSVVLSKTLVRNVTDTLVFQHSFLKYTGLASQPYVSVPEAQGILVKKHCVLILEAPTLTIVLPCPQFNDSEGGNGKLTVKRAMDGTRRIYRRDSPTSKLKYDFVMDRKKAIELRSFVLTQNSTPLKLTNHKGELWMVLLTNSPFTFTEVAFWDSSWGNKSTVTLELEGTRLN